VRLTVEGGGGDGDGRKHAGDRGDLVDGVDERREKEGGV
jgi:hypothetical protein